MALLCAVPARAASLFDPALQDYFWDYTNNGLKLMQLRFYECPTVVPDPANPTAPINDQCNPK